MAIIVLCGKFSKNKKLEDAIPEGHFETDTHHADLIVILSSLFVL